MELASDLEQRLALADKIKGLGDVRMPKLAYWNYEACENHKDVGPQVDCRFRKCGGDLFSHQRVGTCWLYAVQKGLLADDPGVGKTNQILALIALLKERNELRRRAVIIPNTPAVGQWAQEAARWIPNVKTVFVDSSLKRAERIDLYASEWDLLIIGSHLIINDKQFLENLAPFSLVVNDDVDPLLTHDNKTHRAIRDISKGATRSFTVNATTLQVRLQQLHAAFVPIDGYDIFGSLKRFEAHHVKTRLVSELNDKGKIVSYRKKVGYKNMNELRTKIRSRYMRRKATELTDIRMPVLMPPVIEWFEMSATQRARYSELQNGVIRIIRDEGVQVKHATALTKFNYGQQICAGLQALGEPDLPGSSPKLDRLFHQLNTVWADRKVIVFVKNVGMVKAAINRVGQSDFDAAILWGHKMNNRQKEEQKSKFWEDENCRLLIGTTALERSHNLQCANTVVALDTHLNPARMQQILGRAKRSASPHDRVFMFTYLMTDTQESKYLQILRERQAVADFVWEEENDLYESLSALELLELITP